MLEIEKKDSKTIVKYFSETTLINKLTDINRYFTDTANRCSTDA